MAQSSTLPGSGEFAATFGLGAEYSLFDPQTVQIRLVKSDKTGGTATRVDVNNFHLFTL